MSLTASGQISMNDINGEFGRSGTTANSSLEDLSDGTVATINTQNDSADRPDGSAPHAISEFYSYDHDLAGTSWSVADNTGLDLADLPGQTAVSNKDAQMTVSNGSGGTSCSLATTGGPFGTFNLTISASGDPGFGAGTGNSATGYISTSSANSNSVFTGHNSGTRYIRTRWAHSPSNKDGTGAYTLTLTNNSQTATITGDINFSAGGGFGFCIYENIPVNLKEGTANIHDLDVGDMIMSYNWETGQEEEVEIQQIEKRLHDNLYKIMLSDPNDETEGEELKELILTQDHPVYKQDGSMVSDDPDKAKDNYNLDSVAIQPNDLLKILNGKYYAQVHRLEGFPKKHWTYTILTKNNNFYANGVLVHSEIGE